MQLGKQQKEAFAKIEKWYRSDAKTPFYLAGWAGTGKTSLAMSLADTLCGLEQTVVAAYTGKAAHVLRGRGCHDAQTIHSVIYRSKSLSLTKLAEMNVELKELVEAGVDPELDPRCQELKVLIEQEQAQVAQPRFSLNPDSALREASLGLLDEVSMVDQDMALDWLGFGVKTLVLGDPAQLPPVRGEGYFTSRNPDYMLTEIFRQAGGNPIIDLASTVRQKQQLQPGQYGDSLVARRGAVSKDEMRALVLDSDQVICGKNKTRRTFNQKIRDLRGFSGDKPKAGERLVCLRNNHDIGILNGAIYYAVRDAKELDDGNLAITIKAEGERTELDVVVHPHPFRGEDIPWFDKPSANEFDYGYCLTCHKSQGSQFDRPLIWNESSFLPNPEKWLYTAITRAVEKVTVIL